MKKLLLILLCLPLFVFSQDEQRLGQSIIDESDSVFVSENAKNALLVHENLYVIVTNLEDMLSMLQQDVDSGFIENKYVDFYKELLEQSIKLAVTVEIKE